MVIGFIGLIIATKNTISALTMTTHCSPCTAHMIALPTQDYNPPHAHPTKYNLGPWE